MDDQLNNEQVEKNPVTGESQEQTSLPVDEAVNPKKKELSKTRRIWRTFLVWLTVISLAYLAGVLTMNFFKVKPMLEELTQAYQSNASLETQVSSLSSQLDTAVEKADSLQDAKTHREFLQIQVDISSARLALANEDVAAAKSALSKTMQRLEDLLSEIQAVDPGLAVSMPQRLSLIISGLDDNVDNAAVDLGLFNGDLQQLIDTLYGE